MEKKIIIYTDGGARGNPGPAAIGVVFPDLKKEYGEQIGIATNNIAEYKAVIFGLKKAKLLLKDECEKTEIEVRSDSELLVHQMNGKYKVKNENLRYLFVDAQNLLKNFKNVTLIHIPREKNKEADKMVNRALDSM